MPARKPNIPLVLKEAFFINTFNCINVYIEQVQKCEWWIRCTRADCVGVPQSCVLHLCSLTLFWLELNLKLNLTAINSPYLLMQKMCSSWWTTVYGHDTSRTWCLFRWCNEFKVEDKGEQGGGEKCLCWEITILKFMPLHLRDEVDCWPRMRMISEADGLDLSTRPFSHQHTFQFNSTYLITVLRIVFVIGSCSLLAYKLFSICPTMRDFRSVIPWRPATLVNRQVQNPAVRGGANPGCFTLRTCRRPRHSWFHQIQNC